MTTRFQIRKKPTFKEPKWSKASAKAGDEVELQVTTQDLLPGQSVHFEVRDSSDQVLADLKGDKSAKVKWVAPNSPEDMKYHFFAVLREKPGPQNGHLSILEQLKSADLEVKGTKLTIHEIYEAFVPKQETLRVVFGILGEAPKKGRIEIWGERYPTNKPIYSEDFTPESGLTTTESWHGGKEPKKEGDSPTKVYSGDITEDGPLKGKYLTPEFSPYRVRIIIGPDDESVKDPIEKGKGKVCIAESQFEVKFESILIRLHEGLNEAAAEDKHKLSNVLAIEKSPPVRNGTFLAMGRLPEATENGRIRVPMANHWATGEDYDQGGIALADNYTTDKKYDLDLQHYTRPQIPVEFELRLRSRVTENNTDQRKRGLFEPEAIGPVRIEPFIEDYYNNDLYTGGNATYQAYWKNADHKIKRGVHDSPQNSNDEPIFSYWQARFMVGADGDQEFDVSTFDSTFTFSQDDNELTVYLNRTKLKLDDNNDANQFNKDYKELDNEKIKLRPNLTKQNDILWIIRSDSTAAGTDLKNGWHLFPSGTNCSIHYGGLRGNPDTQRNDLFLKKFSDDPVDHEPIIGKRADVDAYPYKDHKYINLKPNPGLDAVDATDKILQERVEVQALIENVAKKGLAGVIFSPSFIAGDSYVIHAELAHFPYERDFGFIKKTAKMHSKTGTLTVWRVNHIHKSIRLPDRDTVGLGPDAGSEQTDDALGGRVHPGNGRNMLMSDMNDYVMHAFNEWTIPEPVRVIGATNDDPVQITTFQNHGLATGDQVKIPDVPGNNAAEGDFVVTVVDNTNFTLHSEFDFTVVNGVGGGVDGSMGGVFPVSVAINNATNEAPIKITTAANHNLANNQEVVLRDVGGNLAANGIFIVTVEDGTHFTLNDSDGNPAGDYTNGGTVQRCGKIDVHRGVNLKTYRTAYFNVTTWNTLTNVPGRVRMDNPTHIQDEFAPFDHYRVQLPPFPDFPDMQRLFSDEIAGLDPGTSSAAALAATDVRYNAWDVLGQPVVAAPGRLIARYPGTADDYGEWVDNISDAISGEILDVLTPQPVQQPPKSMPAVRWPRLYHHSVWINGNTGATNDTYTEGFCSGGGQTFFQSHDLAPTLFTHEMGHSTHLSHFVGDPASAVLPDLCWKHHDLNSQDCLMSYDYTSGYIPKPGGAVGPTGGGAAVDTGWPDAVPDPKPTWNDDSASIAAGVNALDDTIQFTTPRVISGACAKCILKLRGWDEEVLPCAWKHPDLF